MSHNPSDTSGNQEPTGAEQPPSNPAPVGATSEGVGQSLRGLSEVSDIVGLAQPQASALDGFDPAIHATNADGTPRLKRGGGFALKRGRKAGGDPAKPSAPRTSTITPGVEGSEPVRISNDQAALMLARMAVGGFVVALGPEWKVEEKEEKEALVGSVRAYLDATGGMDMSPATGLVMTWGPYAFTRLGQPETQSRLAKFAGWVKSVFQRRR